MATISKKEMAEKKSDKPVVNKPVVILPEKPDQPEPIKRNPNPRANANIPPEKNENKENTSGVGSEITDGEGG